MNNKKFANQVTILILVNLLVKLVWIFFIERKVQLNVGFQNFGMYYSIFTFTLILGVINDPGLNNYLIQYLPKDKTDTKHISELFFLKTFLAALYVVSGITVGLLLGFNDYNLLGLLLLYQILYSFLNYFRGFLKGHQMLKAEIFFSVLDKSLLILAFLPILYFNNGFLWTISFYITAQIIAITLALILCVYILYRNRIYWVGGNMNSEKTNHESTAYTRLPAGGGELLFWKKKITILNKIAPFAFFAFLVLAYNKIDTVMLVKMLPNGAMQTGIYVAAYRFLDAASMFPILFATLFYPVLCKLITNKTPFVELINSSITVLIPITTIIAMTSWFYRSNLMELLYAQESSEQLSLIFGILMFSLPLIAVYYVFSTFFTANNNLKLLNLVSAGGLAVNIGLNILLIPIYQALGAAISSVASFFIVGLAYIILYHIHFKHPFNKVTWLKLIAFTVLMIVLGYCTSYLGFTNWLFSMAVYVLLVLTIAFLFKFFRLKSIQPIIDSKL